MAPRRLIMGKSVPLSPPMTNLAPSKLARREPGTSCMRLHTWRAWNLSESPNTCLALIITVMILFLKIRTKKKQERKPTVTAWDKRTAALTGLEMFHGRPLQETAVQWGCLLTVLNKFCP